MLGSKQTLMNYTSAEIPSGRSYIFEFNISSSRIYHKVEEDDEREHNEDVDNNKASELGVISA